MQNQTTTQDQARASFQAGYDDTARIVIYLIAIATAGIFGFVGGVIFAGGSL